MLEKKGDIFSFGPADKKILRCITTNGILKKNGELVMGAGLALAAKSKYPELPNILGQLVKKNGNHLYVIPELGIASFPTKHDWKNDSDILLIEQSCHELVNVASAWDLILLPRVGTNLGNLVWSDVRKVLAKYLISDKYIVLVQ